MTFKTMMTSRALRVAAPCVALAGVGAVVLRAGPLNPPAGAVSPTYKTLTEVEPRTAISDANTPGDADSRFLINQSGSYYLTGNVNGVSGKHGIEITASNVTLDLAGFSLLGVTGALDGVHVTGSGRHAIVVRNGTASNWPGDGFDWGNSFSYEATNLHAHDNVGIGILGAYNGHIRHCAARSNGSHGIWGGDPSVIDSCVAVFNGGAGIRAPFGESTITNCSAEVNTGPGIEVSDGCVVSGNQCSRNSASGILVTAGGNRIEANNITSNNTGLRVTSGGNLILRNSVSGALPAYDIVTGNRYGPILNLTAGGTAAVSGPAAPGTLTSSDPWANFTY
jgi:parallel beta-helix repeat protein